MSRLFPLPAALSLAALGLLPACESMPQDSALTEELPLTAFSECEITADLQLLDRAVTSVETSRTVDSELVYADIDLGNGTELSMVAELGDDGSAQVEILESSVPVYRLVLDGQTFEVWSVIGGVEKGERWTLYRGNLLEWLEAAEEPTRDLEIYGSSFNRHPMHRLALNTLDLHSEADLRLVHIASKIQASRVAADPNTPTECDAWRAVGPSLSAVPESTASDGPAGPPDPVHGEAFADRHCKLAKVNPDATCTVGDSGTATGAELEIELGVPGVFNGSVNVTGGAVRVAANCPILNPGGDEACLQEKAKGTKHEEAGRDQIAAGEDPANPLLMRSGCLYNDSEPSDDEDYYQKLQIDVCSSVGTGCNPGSGTDTAHGYQLKGELNLMVPGSNATLKLRESWADADGNAAAGRSWAAYDALFCIEKGNDHDNDPDTPEDSTVTIEWQVDTWEAAALLY